MISTLTTNTKTIILPDSSVHKKISETTVTKDTFKYCKECNMGWSPPPLTKLKTINRISSQYRVRADQKSYVWWKEKIIKISNIASFLCIIDCTVLPVLTILFPVLGFVSSHNSPNYDWTQELGHYIALFFVVPVGGITAMGNFLSHGKLILLSISILGLVLVYSANGHGGPILSLLPHEIAHKLHCGTLLHRIVNLTGSGLILGSNFFSQKVGALTHVHGPNCGHRLFTKSRQSSKKKMKIK